MPDKEFNSATSRGVLRQPVSTSAYLYKSCIEVNPRADGGTLYLPFLKHAIYQNFEVERVTCFTQDAIGCISGAAFLYKSPFGKTEETTPNANKDIG